MPKVEMSRTHDFPMDQARAKVEKIEIGRAHV